MNSITSLIHNFDKTEKYQFKLFVKSTITIKNSKLEQALELIFKGYTSKKICVELYGNYPHSGYYSLRKRLTQLVLEFFAYEKGKEFNKSENEVKLFFESGKNLILNKSYKLGFEYLNKALKKAKENEFYSLIIEILMEFIQVAHLKTSINLDALIKEFEHYKQLHNKENTIAIAYAEIKQKLNLYFFNSMEVNALKEIESVFNKYELSIEKDSSYRTLYQLGQLSLATSTVTKNFIQELTSFETIAEKIIESKKAKNFNQWIFKFKLLYLLASSNYRAKRFKKSIHYLNHILKRIHSLNLTIPKEFMFKIVVLKSLNLNYLGENEQAYKTLAKQLKNSKLPKENKNWLDGFGVMSMILFHGGKYSSIIKLYNGFKKSDQYYIKINGLEWVMRKNLILILTHFEKGNVELSEQLIKNFKIHHQQFLEKDQRVLFFIMCIEKVVSNPFQAKNFHFHKFVDSKLEKKPRYEEDIFVLSFFAWLKAKMLGGETYKVTLDIVKNLGVEV